MFSMQYYTFHVMSVIQNNRAAWRARLNYSNNFNRLQRKPYAIKVERIYYVRERVGIIKTSRQHGSKNLALVKDNSAGK